MKNFLHGLSLLFLLLCAVLPLLLSGCDTTAKGFTLPDGNVANGEATFVAMGCNGCHEVAGNDRVTQPADHELSIKLGGKVSRVKTYGQLVSSVINPSHRLARGYPKEMVSEDGKSKMPNFNDVMTVQQLVDLVTFLQDQYELQPYNPTFYPVYYYPVP